MSRFARVRLTCIALAASLCLVAAGCSVGSIGGSGDGDASTTITLLQTNNADDVAVAEGLIEGFESEHPDIAVNLDTRPGGTEGDNLVKTRLSTGEMADVFIYNSGSLFQALDPDSQLLPLGDEPWADKTIEPFPDQVSTDSGLYGAPIGTSSAGAVLYNIPLYEELGLEVPTSWDEFMANNEKIAQAGEATPIIQTYGETWTSQLFVLGDFGNVAAQDPDWAEEYTANNRKYAEQPAVQGFLNQAAAQEAGYFNKDFASATYDEGVAMIASGEGAHYPMLTSAVAALQQNHSDNLNDVGMFALPAQDAADTRLTVWMPGALYIPKTTEGDKREAAKTFIDFVMSEQGCQLQTELSSIAGPLMTDTCELPEDVPQIAKDVQSYYDEEKTVPALEFLSPIKGPNLENITVEVGSGIRGAKEGAQRYDQDVEKQAQQLGLPGW